MSFDNDYPNRKDRRRYQYARSKAVSRGCRNHGSCDWCEGNRTHHNRRRAPVLTQEERAWLR